MFLLFVAILKFCSTKHLFESDYEKLLGLIFNKRLNFQKHIEGLYKKANQKLHVLAQLSNYIDPIKAEILVNSFISSQFTNCPLVWMFNDRATNLKIKLDL